MSGQGADDDLNDNRTSFVNGPMWRRLLVFGVPIATCVAVFMLPVAFRERTYQNVVPDHDVHIRCQHKSPWLFFDKILVISAPKFEHRAKVFAEEFCLPSVLTIKQSNVTPTSRTKSTWRKV